MTQYNNINEISPERFIEMLVLLCPNEFQISSINYTDLVSFIGKCKKANRYHEILGRITILDNDYSPELIAAIETAKSHNILKFYLKYIKALELSQDQVRRIVNESLDELDIMRSFLSEFFSLREENDPNMNRINAELAFNKSRIREVPK